MKITKEFLQERLKNNHFINHLGMNLDEIDDGSAEMSLTVEQHHLQQNGFLHGGVTASILDVVTGIAAYTQVSDTSKNVVTADLKVSYLNPCVSKKIVAKGRVRKGGRFLLFCEGELYDTLEDGNLKLVATCTSIMVSVDIPVV